MKRVLLLLLGMALASSSSTTFAKVRFKCGEYAVSGIIKKHNDTLVLKLYEGTQSEVVLTLPRDLETAVMSFENRAVTINAKMVAPIKNHRGELHSLRSPEEVQVIFSEGSPMTARYSDKYITERVPDPLRPEKDSSLVFVQNLPCAK